MKRHPLRCRCGTLQGYVVPTGHATRAICYCKDCQAFARFLGVSGIVDDQGGTEVVATLPKYVYFTSGLQELACLSLSPRGIFRWYAKCCSTPVGNTPRSPKLPYVSLVHNCLDSTSLPRSFGSSKIAVNTESARGKVPATRARTVAALVKIVASVISADLTGGGKQNPFFTPAANRPISDPHVLSKTERDKAYRS